jgi:hypothetical protein
MSRCASEAFEHGPLPAEALSLAPPVSLIELTARFGSRTGAEARYSIYLARCRLALDRLPAVTRPERRGGLCP